MARERGDRPQQALEGAARRPPQGPPLRHRRRARQHPAQGLLGHRRLQDALRGRHQLDDAPHARDPLRGDAAVLPEVPLATAPARPAAGRRVRPEALGREDRRARTSPRSRRSRWPTPSRSSTPSTLKGAEAKIAVELLKEIRSRLRFLLDVGLNYLTLDRAGALPLGRRGPAHPPGQPDRQRADRRRLRPRRAFDRPPPARQPEAAGGAQAPARHRQHASWWSSTTARRWRRPTGSSTSAPARAATAARSWPRAPRREVKTIEGEPDRPLPARRPARSRCPRERRQGDGRKITRGGRPREQPQGRDGGLPPRALRLRDRGLGRGQEHPRQPDPLPGGGPGAARQRRGRWARTTRSTGLAEIDKVIDIDQSPIGRTPRCNPATYTKLFDLIRDFFALLPEARMHGYTPGRFSLQREGRPLRGLRGRRRQARGDALPGRRLRALRGLPGQALQRRDPRRSSTTTSRSPTSWT